jgi:hypothetical protein
MIDAIGGLNSKYCDIFIKKCIKIFECYRLNNIIIYNTLNTIYPEKKNEILKFLTEKFFFK